MIDNFETEDFEQALKEHADRFFLTPSERVWRSIYNDLHPGSRWPSLAVGLFMILTLFWIGNTNTNGPSSDLNTPEKSVSPGKSIPAPVRAVPVTRSKNDDGSEEDDISSPRQSAANQIFSAQDGQRHADHTMYTKDAPVAHTGDKQPAKVVAMSDYTADRVKKGPERLEVRGVAPFARERVAVQTITNKTTERPAKAATASLASFNNRDGYVCEDRRSEDQLPGIRNLRRKKLKWEYFFSPMISNVKFGGSNLNKSSSSVVYSPVSKHNMDIAKKLGFITGTNVYYPLAKRLSFTTGAHLIYTGYDIYSQVVMPNTTSITFKDSKGKLFSKNYISYYANEKTGSSSNITNYNWQFSVPLGVKWDIFETDNIKISVVSTVEPFMVLGSKAYLLSGDASSYVTDPDLIRRFNVSGNIGSVVTFSSSTVDWKIGPNFRYQILSTYNNIYPVKEHFVNYGIHVGVSKK